MAELITKVLGVVGFAVMGDWNSADSYSQLNVVYHDGSTYAARVNVPPGVEPGNSSGGNYWQLLLSGSIIESITAGTPSVSGGSTVTPVTVTLVDGTTQTFNITAENGTDGTNGTDGATIESMTAGTSSQDDGYTVTPVTVGMTDDRQLSFSVRAQNGVSVTGATSGDATQQDGYTVTPITFQKSDGSSDTVNVYASNPYLNQHHYIARWDKTLAQMTRMGDAAGITTDTSNFGNFGSVNPDYDNPFDSIYPWSGIRICNIDLDAYMALQPGDSITGCVKAWDGDPDFDWNDDNGVWRYRPEFWGNSWDDGTYRYFDVTDRPAGGYVHYPEAIAGRWHGCALTKTVNGSPIACLIPKYQGMPAASTPLSTLHTYAKNYGATLDSIYSIDADLLLLTVEYATMNSQSAIGNGATSLYRQGGYQIAAASTDSNVIKVLAADAGDYFVYGAILDIGTTDGGNQVGSYYVISAAPDTDPTYLNVTLNTSVTVTRDNYWSIHGLINLGSNGTGSKSGYGGTNGRAIAFYRGMELYGNMWFYTLGAYENAADKHIWIATDADQADAYDALDTSVHIDTGLVLPTSSGYIQTLGLPPRSGLLALPPFCTAIGGSSANPVGDYFYNGDYTYNTVLLRGGSAIDTSIAGALGGGWSNAASISYWSYSARPLLKTPQGVLGGTQSP